MTNPDDPQYCQYLDHLYKIHLCDQELKRLQQQLEDPLSFRDPYETTEEFNEFTREKIERITREKARLEATS